MTELRKKVEDNCSKALEVMAAAHHVLSAQRRRCSDPEQIAALDRIIKDCAWAGVAAQNTLDMLNIDTSEKQLTEALHEVCRLVANMGFRLNALTIIKGVHDDD